MKSVTLCVILCFALACIGNTTGNKNGRRGPKPVEISIPLKDVENIPYQSEAVPQSGMFFKNSPANKVFVFDLQRENSVARMVASAMQGVINSEKANVCLMHDYRASDMLKRSGIDYTLIPRYKHVDYGGLTSLYLKYKNKFDKLIVWDESKDWTWCIALMMSAQQKGIPVTAKIKDYLVSLGWNKKIEDISGRWTTAAEAYDWALEELAPNCHKNLTFTAGLRGDYKTTPWTIYDYATASKGFVFYLAEDNPNELPIIHKIFSTLKLSPGAACMGYGKGVSGAGGGDDLNKIMNRYNSGFVVADYYANGSFWCAYPSQSFQQRPGQAIDVKPGKIYVSLIWSDGDNVQFDANTLYDLFREGKKRGEIPVGVTLAPGLQELNPLLLEYFYKNMKNTDELMAGPSGFQFIYGTQFSEGGDYGKWLSMNRLWMQTAGFHTACVWNTDGKLFDRYMETCGLQGVFDGNRNPNKLLYGIMAFDQGLHCWKEGDVFEFLHNTKPNPKEPIFKNCYLIVAGNAYNGGVSEGYERLERELIELERRNPGVYHFLLPKDLAATATKYYKNK